MHTILSSLVLIRGEDMKSLETFEWILVTVHYESACYRIIQTNIVLCHVMSMS